VAAPLATGAGGPGGNAETITGNTSPNTGTAGQVATTTASQFTVTGMGNIDTDTAVDQWHVSDSKTGLTTADANDV
ncbi:MAG: hypothetical protein ACREI9_00670, partial [Nitrospiraceae bacterium]